MTGGLIVRLRPHEKFVVNGVILENGEKRAKIRIKSQDVNVLRLRDAMHPQQATTPVKRLYYIAQLAVTGDLDAEAAIRKLSSGLKDIYEAFTDEKHRSQIRCAQSHLEKHAFYKTMRALKTLLPDEEELLLLAKARGLQTSGANTN